MSILKKRFYELTEKGLKQRWSV